MSTNWKDLHGRAIRFISFHDEEHIEAREATTLSLHYEYHGEYDDAWVVEYHDGKEAARHNVRYLVSIIWD